MRYPDRIVPDDKPLIMDVLKYGAVELFAKSAQRVRSGFELYPTDVKPVITICHLVEGMPLGLELAASLVDMLSPDEIATEIKAGFEVLEAELQDAPERHQSIRVLFDRTWNVMSEQERVVFKKLSVFRGDFTRASAKYVADASLRQLQILLNKSLIRWNKEGRYEIHELLRQYGAEKLEEDPVDETMVRDHHSAYYCDLLLQRYVDIRFTRKYEILIEIENDSENIRAAWLWAVTRLQLERIAQTIDSLGYFYEVRCFYQEGESASGMTVDTLMDFESTEGTSIATQRLLANALTWQGHFYALRGQRELAIQNFRKSLEFLDCPLLADQDTRSERAFLLEVRGRLAFELGYHEESNQCFEKSLGLYLSLGEKWEAAEILLFLGNSTLQLGKIHEAKQHYKKGLTLARGNPLGVVDIQNGLGNVARNLMNYEKARRLFNESLALSKEKGIQRGIINSLYNLAWLGLFQGKFEESVDYLQQSVEISRETGDRDKLGNGLLHLGVALWLSGKHDQGYPFMEEGLRIFNDLEDDIRITVATYLLSKTNVYLGKYEKARSQAQLLIAQDRKTVHLMGDAQRVLGWVALVEEKIVEAQKWTQESVATFRGVKERENMAWSLAALGRASHALGNRSEAQHHLYEALEIAVEIRAFIPLLYIMPIVSFLLADQGEVERAVELYSMASQHTFVSQGQLFEDIAGRQIAALAASLPSDVVEAAKARGETLEMWEAASGLLESLPKLGWSKPAD
jgi:tetratricopeptide (TPR) repeat protein